MSILLVIEDGDAGERATWQSALREALPRESFVTQRGSAAEAGEIDVAIVANPAAGALAGLPRLQLVQSLWAGVERLLADASLPAGVAVARMVDPVMTDAMAQTALWAVLGLHRGFPAYAERQRRAQWQPHAQRRAEEVNVAVLGLGALGLAVARRLAANGYRVRGWGSAPRTLDGIEALNGAAALDALLARSDIVVNLLPLTAATRGLFDAACFARMKRGAGFVNLARGAHVVEADLLAALDAGQVGHAVLDVFAVEPLPPAHAFWRHPAVTVLPHVAALTDVRSAAAVAAANVEALRAGRPLRHRVDRARGY
jgi:glyoxylate/hydroxypyruvate reductase A